MIAEIERLRAENEKLKAVGQIVYYDGKDATRRLIEENERLKANEGNLFALVAGRDHRITKLEEALMMIAYNEAPVENIGALCKSIARAALGETEGK